MAEIPKHIEKLLKSRFKLACDLTDIENRIDNYCKEIGIPECDNEACLCTDIMIYTEPYAAMKKTRAAIEKQLRENEGGKENGKKGANVKGEEGKNP